MTCPSAPKPDYATFMADYESYIATAASGTNLPISAIASQWFAEWGIPYNNPGNVTASEGFCTTGTCGTGKITLPMFCTLEDGVQAYITNVNNLYQGKSGSATTIYGKPSHWTFNWQWGFEGGQTSLKAEPTDNGCSQVSTSQAFYGVSDTPSGATKQQIQAYREQASEAVMEAMGASPWDGGHYWFCGQSYAGQALINIAIDSGWLYSYS